MNEITLQSLNADSKKDDLKAERLTVFPFFLVGGLGRAFSVLPLTVRHCR